MNKYNVYVPFSAFYVYEVEAENAEQAKELVLDGTYGWDDIVSEDIQMDGLEVEEI